MKSMYEKNMSFLIGNSCNVFATFNNNSYDFKASKMFV